MNRSSIYVDHSNKIYDDRRIHEAIDSARPLTIVSRMQPDAIRMWHYRGPLAIVCEENERVNCHRSVNCKSRTLRRRARKFIGASLIQGDFSIWFGAFACPLHQDALLGFLAWIVRNNIIQTASSYVYYTIVMFWRKRESTLPNTQFAKYAFIEMMTCFIKRMNQNRPSRSVNVLRNVRRATLDGNTGPIHSSNSRFLSFIALWNSSSDITPSRSTSSFFNSESIKSYDAINTCYYFM